MSPSSTVSVTTAQPMDFRTFPSSLWRKTERGYIWAGSEGGLYRYDGTRFRLMAAAEGLPCATEVHALHVAADGALWANTCARIFRFDGQRFHAIAGIGGMLAGAQRMANDAHGNVVMATPDGLYEAVSTAPVPTPHVPIHWGRRLAGTPCAELRGTVRNSGLAAAGSYASKTRGAFRSSARRKDCPKTPGTQSPYTRTVPSGSAVRGKLYRKPPGAAQAGPGKAGDRIQHLLGRLDHRP